MIARTRPIDDRDTLLAALQGDRVALDRVIAAWLPSVYAWCGRLGAGRIDPEEAAHDVMMTFDRRHATVRSPEQLGTWLFSTTRRVVANHRRLAWFRRWAPNSKVEERVAAERTDANLERRQLAERVLSLLDQLSANHREVLILCYFEERPVEEAGEILGVPPGTVKSRLFHARKRFRSLYESEES